MDLDLEQQVFHPELLRIAEALEALLALYRAHISITAGAAALSVRQLQTDDPRVSGYIESLERLLGDLVKAAE